MASDDFITFLNRCTEMNDNSITLLNSEAQVENKSIFRWRAANSTQKGTIFSGESQ